jgi:hypothetical protein
MNQPEEKEGRKKKIFSTWNPSSPLQALNAHDRMTTLSAHLFSTGKANPDQQHALDHDQEKN